jgi:hypothetical protein
MCVSCTHLSIKTFFVCELLPGVCLLVDATEGPMAQTKFVLMKVWNRLVLHCAHIQWLHVQLPHSQQSTFTLHLVPTATQQSNCLVHSEEMKCCKMHAHGARDRLWHVESSLWLSSTRWTETPAACRRSRLRFSISWSTVSPNPNVHVLFFIVWQHKRLVPIGK